MADDAPRSPDAEDERTDATDRAPASDAADGVAAVAVNDPDEDRPASATDATADPDASTRDADPDGAEATEPGDDTSPAEAVSDDRSASEDAEARQVVPEDVAESDDSAAHQAVPEDVAESDDSAAHQAVPEDVSESGDSEARRAVPEDVSASEDAEAHRVVPDDVRKYERFKKMDGAQYERVNGFLRDRTYITAREWAIARLCVDFRTETGVEMTKIGENLPELVPFMTDTYTPQAVNQARSSFEGKVRKAGATFLYGAMSNFFTAEELDDIMYEVTEVAKFLLEVEGVNLTVDEELEAEDRISSVMREVRASSEDLRHDTDTCPNCGHDLNADD